MKTLSRLILLGASLTSHLGSAAQTTPATELAANQRTLAQAPLVEEAMKRLGIQRRAMIFPIFSAPPRYDVKRAEYRDAGIGNWTTAGEFALTAKALWGIDSLMLLPEGNVSPGNVSPYSGSPFTLNPYFIDLERLTTTEDYELLTPADLSEALANPAVATNRVNYNYLFSHFDPALERAYGRFLTKLPLDTRLRGDLEAFLRDNPWLERLALFEGFAAEHGHRDWRHWAPSAAGVDDRALFAADRGSATAALQQRAQVVRQRYSRFDWDPSGHVTLRATADANDPIGRYVFRQFLADHQRAAFRAHLAEQGLRLIVDFQLSFDVNSPDAWAYRAALRESADGTPWAYGPRKDGKLEAAWSLAAFDFFAGTPERIQAVNELIEARAHRAFALGDNVRMDALAELLFDVTYEVGPRESATSHELDPIGDIESIAHIGQVVGDALEAQQGWRTRSEDNVLEISTFRYGQLGRVGSAFPGARLQMLYNLDAFERGVEAEVNDLERGWLALGSHDTPPLILWTHRDPALYQTRLAQLFRGRMEPNRGPDKIQIPFTDLFGMEEAINHANKLEDQNWTLRVPVAGHGRLYEGPTAPVSFLRQQLNTGYGMNAATTVLKAYEARKGFFEMNNQPASARQLERDFRSLLPALHEAATNAVAAP